jgi:branched-chain amino acid transport system substrate-binding protein
VSIDERCDYSLPEDLFDAPDLYRDTVVIGALYNFDDHLDTLQATELAFRQVAERSEEAPAEFALVACDASTPGGTSAQNEERNAELADYLANQLGVQAIIGPRGSARTIAAWDQIKDGSTLLISPSATSPTLTGLDQPNPTDAEPGRLWRSVPPDTLQSVAMVADMRARDVTDIAVIYQGGAYGDSLFELLQSEFTANGGNAPSGHRYTTDLADAVADVASLDVEEVVLISSDTSDYVDFLNAATTNASLSDSYDQRGLFLTDAAYDERLFLEPGADAEILFDNIRGSRPAVAEGALFDSFSAAYALEFGTDPAASGFTAHAYDAAWLVLYGAIWAAFNESEIDGNTIARGLRRVSSGTEVQIRSSGWPEVLEAFEAGQTIDVEGASGSLNFDPSNEETTAPIELWRLADDGEGWFFDQVDVIEP